MNFLMTFMFLFKCFHVILCAAVYVCSLCKANSPRANKVFIYSFIRMDSSRRTDFVRDYNVRSLVEHKRT